MTVLDAYAVVAALLGEPAASHVEALLRDADDPSRISAVNVAEVVDVLVRVGHVASGDVTDRISWLRAGGLQVLPADDNVALLAGELRARRYHRSSSPLSLADCFALATAASAGAALATADPALAAAATAEGVRLVALPDSRGRTP